MPDSVSSPCHSSLDPNAIPLADLAKLLTRVGGSPVTEATLRADVEAGAPTNADGSFHLVRYAAWLVREADDD